MKKEKVVAVRLTTEQYEALEWSRVNIHADEPYTKNMSQFLGQLLKFHIDGASQHRDAKLKREEAAAKRRAKKAANDPK